MVQLIPADPRLQLEKLVLGVESTNAWTLPASATTQTLFTVAGNIFVTGFFGIVKTAIGSTATTLALGTAPTTGTASTTGIATATAITSAEAGTWLVPLAASGVAGALVVGSNGGKSVFDPTPFIVPTGTITATTSANAGGGAITWYLAWIPLDNFASVT